MGLTRLAITRPVLIVMLMLAALLIGRIAYNSMRVELNPDVQFGVVTVTTVYPGAGPDEMQNLVSRPIEDAVSSVARLREVTSSSQEGVSTVVLNFEIGADMDSALNEVRAKVDSVVGQLPREVERPVIDKADTSSDPVIRIALSSDTLTNREIRDIADDKLRDMFARIGGVAGVIVAGGDRREIQVRLKRDALLANGVGIVEVQQAVQQAGLNIPSGRIVEGGKETTVRVQGEFGTVAEIENVYIVVRDPDGQGPSKSVRLGDIAHIVDTNAEKRTLSRLNGADSVTIIVQKAKVGNAVQISKAIRQPEGKSLLDTIETDFGINSVVTLDASQEIEESLADLNFALAFGIVLVVLVVWLFLHNLRGTMIVAIAIPVCLMATFIALWVMGQTINNLSMLALSLAIGVLVDDAIVVIENIYRHLTLGEDPVDAAVNGRSEIGVAAIAITLVDVVVFLPIANMGGIVGQFFKPLAIGYIVAVSLSLFVSFTITPMLASRWYRRGEDWEHPKDRFSRGFEHMFEAFARKYRKAVEWSLHHRWFTFCSGWVALVGMFMFIGGSFAGSPMEAVTGTVPTIMMATIIGAVVFLVNCFRRIIKPQFILFGFLFGLVFPVGALAGHAYAAWKQDAVFKFSFFPPNDSGQVQVSVDLPPGSSLDSTLAVVKNLEATIGKHPEVEYVTSSIGSRSSGFGAGELGSNYAVISATLHDKRAIMDAFSLKKAKHLRDIPDTEVAADLTEAIGRVPGARVNVGAGNNFGFGPAIQMSFRSDDREQLIETAKKIRDRLSAGVVKGVVSVDISSKPGKPELRAVPERARLGDAGVNVAELGAAMRVLYEGDIQSKYRVKGQEYDIRVLMDYGDRNREDLLRDMPIVFKQGDPMFLGELARLESKDAVEKIDRRDRQVEVQVTASLLPGFAAGTVQQQIDDTMTKEKWLPEEVSYRPLGQADFQAQETGFLMSALGLGFVLVFMVLASLYNNYLYPLIIQLAQPQALVGALLALILTDKTLNIVGFIGLIAMVGLVGKNAILLVDYANTLRERGKDRFTALAESGQTRLRPILMTTTALVFGMLPVAMAIGRGSEFRETIGITIIGGTVLSTFLTLLVIPCSYSIFDDFAGLVRRLKDKIST